MYFLAKWHGIKTKHTCRFGDSGIGRTSVGWKFPELTSLRSVSSGNFQPPSVRPIPDSPPCKYVYYRPKWPKFVIRSNFFYLMAWNGNSTRTHSRLFLPPRVLALWGQNPAGATTEAQARFARARLCLPYNEGRKHWDQNSPDVAYVTRNYPRFFTFKCISFKINRYPLQEWYRITLKTTML